MNDDRLGGGVSPEKAEQLRQLLSALEEKVRNSQHQARVDELPTGIAKTREAVESGNRLRPFTEFAKSVRNIAEGIAGAAIYDLIPSNIKSHIKKELLEADQDPRDVKDRCLYAVRVQIMFEALEAFQFAVEAGLPFAFTLKDLEMRIWCGPDLAAQLRLVFEKSGIEHPTNENSQIPLRVLRPPEAEAMKAKLEQTVAEVARAILRSAAGSSPEHAGNDALAGPRRPKAVPRRAILQATRP